MIAQSRNDANEISKCVSYNLIHISIKKIYKRFDTFVSHCIRTN